MAGWTDIGGGQWQITPTITVPEIVKERFEQVRKGINAFYFTTASALTDEDFFIFLLIGKLSDRAEEELNGQIIPSRFSFDRLWLEFKKWWVDRYTRVFVSVDDGETEALAVVVPAPPAP